ncbi:PH domain-containing protein [Virgibacillus ainsalahensis]
MSKQQRLHPAAILFNFVKSIREAIFLIVLGFITFRDESLFYFILIGSVFLIILITSSALSWYRFTYRVENDELRIEYGVFIRRKRFISKNRIQSIDLTSGVLHRIFKLTKVQIETAGSGAGAEASLQAVTLAEGERLRNELKKGKVQEAEATEEEEGFSSRPTFQITFKRLFLAGTTSGSIGVILAIFAFLFSQFQQFIPDGVYNSTVDWVIGLSVVFIIGLSLLLLIILWLLGIAGTMIKYGNFTITKNEDELFITRGLLEKKQITLPLKRIQAIGIQESIIRQPLGYVTVFAEVAGGAMEKGEDFSTVLFPIMKREEAEDFLEDLLPNYSEHAVEFNALPKRALKFYLIRAVFPFLLITAGVMYFIPQIIWAAIVLIVVSLYLGFLQYRDAGVQVNGKRFSIRYRTIGRTTVRIFHKRIQAFEKKQHKIQKLQKLASIKLSIISKLGAGKHYNLKQLEEQDVDALSDWYSYRR